MKKKQNIMLSVIGIATLLIAIVGATFAWFSIQTSGEVEAETSLTTANLGTVTFVNGNIAEAIDIYPGWNAETIAFSVIGSNTVEEIEYTVTATVTGSTKLAGALTYSMECVSTNGGTCASTVTSAPLSTTTYTGTLATGSDTHTYTVNMSFPETNTNQNEYQGLNYKVEFSVVLTNPATKWTHSGEPGSRTALAGETPAECFTTNDLGSIYRAKNVNACVNAYIDAYDISTPEDISDINILCSGGELDGGWTLTDDIEGGKRDGIDLVALYPNAFEVIDAIEITGYLCGGRVISGDTGTWTITEASTGEYMNVIIPSKIDGKIVTRIGERAFCPETEMSYNNNPVLINSLVIPESVTSIGENAFANNQLTKATLSNGLINIDYYAFYGNKLTKVTIPNSVYSILGYAFSSNSLTNVCIKGKSSKNDFEWFTGSFDDTSIITWNCTE